MSKKNSYRIIFVIGVGLCLYSCTTPLPDTAKETKDVSQLKQIDRSFSKLSVDSGMAVSFLQYAADDVVKLDMNNYPTIGKEQMRKNFDGPPPPIQLSWEPVGADIAGSGELGYTWGNYQLKLKNRAGRDTVLYGNYVTVWKKQADGSWKYVLDGGNPTPPPAK